MLRHLLVSLCLLAAAAILVSPAAYALPTYRGYTGLNIIPTADALNQGLWQVGVTSEDVSDTINNYFVFYGITDGLEVGINARQPRGETGRDTVFSGKYRFVAETAAIPAVSAGIIDVTDEEEVTAYVVASKSIVGQIGTFEGEIISPRVHVGLGAGQFSPIFGGVNVFLGPRIQLMAEYDSDEWHAGGRFRLTPGLTFHAGFFAIGKGTTFGLGGSFGRYF